MAPPRWLVDEMLGRLARYLRFVGCDTRYGKGATDDELLGLAEREDRLLLTRDRVLSQRTPRAFLVESPVLSEQWKAVRRRWPSVPTTVAFDRCSVCNGPLEVVADPGSPAWAGVPEPVQRSHGPLYACRECGHRYWEGSHTARIRVQIQKWEEESRS